MADSFDGLTIITGIDHEDPVSQISGEGVAVALAARKVESAGMTATSTHACVSSDFGGASPVPPAMKAAQRAEAERRRAPTSVEPKENLESD